LGRGGSWGWRWVSGQVGPQEDALSDKTLSIFYACMHTVAVC
jgi:hypothetical protein